MKRSLALLFSVFLLLSLFACKDKNNDDTPDSSPSSESSSSEKQTSKEKSQPSEKTPSTPDTVTYTVTWSDENGKRLSSRNYSENSKITAYSYDPKDDAEWDYTLDGWSTSLGGTPLSTLPNATSDITFFACVSRQKRSYTVSFQTGSGSSVASQSAEYGTSLTVSDKPSWEGHRFTGWTTDAAGNQAVDFPMTVTGNVTLYANYVEQVDLSALLSSLLNSELPNPWKYVPETLRPSSMLVSSEPSQTFAANTSLSSTISGGHGEQWHMVTENIAQSQTFYNLLSVLETISSTAVASFNNYLDENPSDTADYTFLSGIYSISILYENEILSFVVDYSLQLPVLGLTTIQIAMKLDTSDGERTVRVQMGEANSILYTIKENKYSFAIQYLGVRTAFFEAEKKNDGSIEGHIYEHLTVKGVGLHSSADFYIGETYASVVGNKAGGMIGFTGYINELYSVSSGKLLGYEVRETLSSITYNTLWFNLTDVTGIQSLRYQAAEGNQSASFFVNGNSTAWAVKNVGGLNLKTLSRRYDIEFRTQYFYSSNPDGTLTEYAVSVPMLFVQEEQFGTLATDISSQNSGLSVSIALSQSIIAKIQSDYDTLIDVFILGKEQHSEKDISSYIGSAISH